MFVIVGALWVNWCLDAGGHGLEQAHVAAILTALYALFNAGRFRGAIEWWGLGTAGAVAGALCCTVLTLVVYWPVHWVGAALREAGRIPSYELRAASYLGWCLVQDFILCSFCAAHLEELIPSRILAALIAGGFFGLGHVPHEHLVCITFAAGSFWAWVFLSTRSLWPIVATHWVLGLALLGP